MLHQKVGTDVIGMKQTAKTSEKDNCCGEPGLLTEIFEVFAII